jgi:hypothetical protein
MLGCINDDLENLTCIINVFVFALYDDGFVMDVSFAWKWQNY